MPEACLGKNYRITKEIGGWRCSTAILLNDILKNVEKPDVFDGQDDDLRYLRIAQPAHCGGGPHEHISPIHSIVKSEPFMPEACFGKNENGCKGRYLGQNVDSLS